MSTLPFGSQWMRLLGVGAAVFHDGKLLLIQRGQEPLRGWWTLPGGLVETGEHLEAAVRRETLEETGLTVKPAGIAAVFERIMADRERLGVMLLEEVVDLANIDGAHQKPGSALFGFREQSPNMIAGGLPATHPLDNRPRIKNASLHVRAPVS